MVETDRSKAGEVAASILRPRHPQRHVEHYWLCDDCAAQWSLVYDRERGVALAPVRRGVLGVGDAGTGDRSGAA